VILKFRALLLSVLIPAAGAAHAASGDLPQVGDHLKTLPGQPLCANVDELVQYLRAEMGTGPRPGKFKTCGAMPSDVDYVVLAVSSDDPEIPIRPARIRVIGPGGGSVVGWTVLVSDDDQPE